METKQVMYDSPEAARFVEGIKGWVDINNRFFGDNKDSEHMARFSSCTHRLCDCGNIMERGYSKCRFCINNANIERYNALPFREWDGVTPVYSETQDTYFFNEQEIIDYCEDEEILPERLRLVLCKPNNFSHIDYEQWQDIMPDDVDELPKKLLDGIEALNKIIDELPPASYSPGKIRTEYKDLQV